MPRYDYSCPECGWAGERNVPADQRDAQQCNHRRDDDPKHRCQAKLTREEIPLNQGRMAHNWGDWNT